MKKIIFLIISVLLVVSFCASAAEYTVADFTSYSASGEYNLPVSSERTKSGLFTLKWSGYNLYKNIVCPIDKRDYNNGVFSMWVFSTFASKSDFQFVLVSDNSETPEMDCYYANFWNYWLGWKELKFDKEDFETYGNPAGFENADTLILCSLFNGNVPKTETELFIDRVIFKK
ncbi:MAG: hypothetical protein IJC74_05370 [Clostridia bacterium]|nr:hypothetical protein [Clostridia bacterium]